MKILAIDSSSLTCSVALSEDNILRALFSIQYKTTHSQILMPMLSDIREKLGLQMDTVDAVAVSSGPGSFTGLRIGAATAKGLCLALDVPLIPVPTLDAMAYRLWGTKGLVVPIMDAKRGQVYTGIYRYGDTGASDEPETVMSACAVSIEELLDRIREAAKGSGERVYFLGDAVLVHRETIDKSLEVPHSYAPLHLCAQSADTVAALAFRRISAADPVHKAGVYADADSFTPDYMRLSQAERQALHLEETPVRKKKDPVHIRTRLFVTEDVDQASALEKECLGSEAWSASQLQEAAKAPDTLYLVTVLEDRSDASKRILMSSDGEGAYREGDRIIGLCGIKNVAGCGEITNVCVDPGYRRSGVGRKMLTQLLERAKGLGAGDCTLEVRAGNTAACALYESLGFVCEGVRPGFYSEPAEDARIYWLRSNLDKEATLVGCNSSAQYPEGHASRTGSLELRSGAEKEVLQ